MAPNKICLTYVQVIDPLPEVDHTEIDYEPFTKNFYEEHEEISKMNLNEVQQLYNKLGIKVRVCTGIGGYYINGSNFMLGMKALDVICTGNKSTRGDMY